MARRIPELLAHLQVCAEGFEDEDATVVCRQLGYVIPGQPAKGRALPGFPKCVGQDCWSGRMPAQVRSTACGQTGCSGICGFNITARSLA